MRQNLTSRMKDLTKAMNKISSGEESSQPMRILEYMSQIPQNHKDELFELYKIDFEMFDYEYKQFLGVDRDFGTFHSSGPQARGAPKSKSTQPNI